MPLLPTSRPLDGWQKLVWRIGKHLLRFSTYTKFYPFPIYACEGHGSGLLVVVIRVGMIAASGDGGLIAKIGLAPLEGMLFLSRPFHFGKVTLETLEDGTRAMVGRSGEDRIVLR